MNFQSKLNALTTLTAVLLSSLVHASPFQPVREDQVPSGIEYEVKLPPVESPDLFRGKRVAILASHGVEESEITFPYDYLSQRGATVDVLVPQWASEGITASRFLKPTLWVNASGTFRKGLETVYDLVVLTGGAWNAQVVRTDNDALKLISEHYKSGRPLAAICAGTVVLINAGIAPGKLLTGSPTVAGDLINAGARFVDQPAVLSDQLLTSRTPNDLPQFVAGLRQLLIAR